MTVEHQLVKFPDEWSTGAVVDHHMDTMDGLVVAFVLLSDDTTLAAVAYPGGHRMARVSPAINWAIQESLGPDPRDSDAEAVTQVWQLLVSGLPRMRDVWNAKQ